MNKNIVNPYSEDVSSVFDGINPFNAHKCIDDVLYGFYKSNSNHLYSKSNTIDLDSLPTNLTEIDRFCFMNNKRINAYITSTKLKFIGNNAFTNSSIKKLKITNKLEYIGVDAFAYCINLEEIYLEGEYINIMSNAFAYCSNLKSVIIRGYTNIESNAFLGCSNLKSIHINDCSLETFKKLIITPNAIRTYNLDSKIYQNCKRNNLITNDIKDIFINSDDKGM